MKTIYTIYISIAIFLFDIWGSCYMAYQISWGEWKVYPIIATSVAIAIVGLIVLNNGIRYRNALWRSTLKP